LIKLIGSSAIRLRASCGIIAATILALATVSVVAQAAPRSLSGTFRIAGRVLNASTGEAVSRATVALLTEEDNHAVASVQSDANGRFSFEGVPAGKYPLTASKRGYRGAFYDEHDDFNSAIVTGADQQTEDLAFRLMPESVLHGVVTGDGGDPVEGANVMLFRRPHANSPGERLAQAGTTTTDDIGEYEFGNLAAGEYLVAVTASPWYAMHVGGGSGNAQPSPLDVAYPATYFDSTTDEASASPVILAGGSREVADINLHAVPALHFNVATPPKRGSGIARPELRQIVFGVQIAAESTGFLDAMATGTVEYGGVAPGHYQLVQGNPSRIVDLNATDNQDIDPGAGAPAPSVSGTLQFSGAGAAQDETNVTLEPVEEPSGRQPMLTTAHKGQFRFDAVAPGTWSIAAESGGQVLTVIALAAGGVATPGSQFTLKDRHLTLVATISRGGVRVQGFAQRGTKGAAGVMVVLVPRQPSAYHALVRRDQSDSDGSFSLRNVPRGHYTAIAIEDGWKLDWQQRDVIARFLPGGVTVTINEKSAAIVPLFEPVPVQAP
jgi:protocatechuate 3,4-dioxygenase beta subunit